MKGQLKGILEHHVADAGGNMMEGQRRFASEIVEFMKDPEFNPQNFHIRELFDATVLAVRPDLDLSNPVEISEAAGQSQFPYITNQLISKELIPAYEVGLNDMDQLVTEGSTTHFPYENVAGMRAITKMPRVQPGQNIPSAQWAEKNCRVEIAKFSQILDIEIELVISDQTGEILTRARQGGDMMGDHRQRFIVETITDTARDSLEEATSTALYFDGSARTVFANDHSSWDDYANDNLAASSAIGTAASWDTVFGLLGTMQDEKGRYVTNMPKAVLCHPTVIRQAWQQSSDLALADVGSANRGSNFFAQKLQLKSYHSAYITTSTDWYMGDMAKQTRWLWYVKPRVDRQGVNSDAAFERDVIARFKYHYTGGCGKTDYRRVVKATA